VNTYLNNRGWVEYEELPRIDLAMIGAILRETRERRGTSIAAAAEALSVKKSTLGDIEAGRWDTLPHPVYVKGYVKSYASYLAVPERIETYLSARPKTTQAEGSGSKEEAPEWKTKPNSRNMPAMKSRWSGLSPIALRCLSLVGFLLGLVVLAGIRAATVVGLNDVLVGCHLTIADVRRVILS
jgi:cytoskeletal protein RodZ